MAWDDCFDDAMPALEARHGDLLDESLAPRGPGVLFQVVRELGLPPDSRVADVGCRGGDNAFRLATHFGFRVLGIDPLQRHLDVARQARRDEPEEIGSRVSFERGSATAVPVRDGLLDLVWLRDTLLREPDAAAVFEEAARVLRPGGWVVAHQVVATPLLDARDARWLFGALGIATASTDPGVLDAAIAGSGLEIVDTIDLSSEWAEWAEEQSGRVSRALLRLARLVREPDRYRAHLGDEGYDAVLADSRWQVHRMTGGLAGRVDVLRAPSP